MSKESQPRQAERSQVKPPTRSPMEFDREFIVDSFGPPTTTARAKWQRAQRKRGRPRQGSGVRVISVSLEKKLLNRCDALAKRIGVSRSSLISRGLREVLAADSR